MNIDFYTKIEIDNMFDNLSGSTGSSNISGGIQSDTISQIWVGSQNQYNEIPSPNNSTLYVIVENEINNTSSINSIWLGSELEYNSLSTINPSTLYIINN